MRTGKENYTMNNKKMINFFRENNNIIIMLLFPCLIFIMNFIQNDVVKLLIYSISYIGMVLYLFYICKFRIKSVLVMFSVFHMVFIGIGPIPSAIRVGIYYPKTYNLILISYYVFCLTVYIIYNSSYYKEKCNKLSKEIKKENINHKKIIISSYVLIIISMIAEAVYLIKNFQFLFGGNMEQGRITSLQGNGILLYSMWFGLVGLSCLLKLVLNNKYNVKLFFLIYLIYGLSSVLIGFRSRFITLILITVLLYIQEKKEIPFKKIALYGSVILIVTVLLGGIRSVLSGNGSLKMFTSLSIIFENGVLNLNNIMNSFPQKVKYQYGYTFFLNFIMLKPGPDVDFTLWLKEMLNMKFAGGGVTPTLVGELYINFGHIGTYIAFSILAGILVLLDELYKRKISTFNVVVIIWAMLIACRGGIANSEINILLFVIVYNFVMFISRKEGKNEKHSII